jgi:hypothetical protein
MLRNMLLWVAFFFLLAGKTTAKNCGIVFYNDHAKKFKVYANGVLQNEQYKSQVEICCFPSEELKVKVEFENSKSVEGTIFLRENHMEYDYVSESGIEFDHYERVPKDLKKTNEPKLLNETEAPKPSLAKKSTCGTPRSYGSFYEFYNHLLRHGSFDDEKLIEAKSAISAECFTSKQVNITMSAFTGESAKLAFAKYAYDYVTDKSAYSIVRDRLTETPALVEFDRFIQSRQDD